MSRPKNPLPTYKRHGAEARCWVNGRYVTLGPWQSKKSKERYARLCAEVRASAVPKTPGKGTSVGELLIGFRAHAEVYFRRADGTATNEVEEFGAVARVMRELYGESPATEFGPLALQAVRQKMIDIGWCRTRVNRQVGRVRRIFRWGVTQEVVPVELVTALECVDGLKKNRTRAKEREPVEPASDRDIEAVLPFLVPTLRTMVRLQRAAGWRPGEIRELVPEDIDRGGPVWVYQPEKHKMAHLGRDRASPIPAAARAILAPLLERTKPGAYVFSPATAAAERWAKVRATRTCKVYPCEKSRRRPVEQLRRAHGACFTGEAYANWLRRGCERAGLTAWFAPNQLRHAFATEVRARFGLEAAQVLLGHARADVTQTYAERNWALGVKVAGEM